MSMVHASIPTRSTGLTEAVRSLEVRGAAAANNDDGGAKGGETDKRGGMPTDATGTPAEIIHPRGGELSASAATTATAVTIGIAPLTAHIVVDTLPDVPGVPRVICKVSAHQQHTTAELQCYTCCVW